ncbi:carboxypeptidase-like regulatory domain-containing protein [Flavobacterium caeni]|uniref:Carboxypeptidase regulatory-like domain-containing protein n=1 Tax=Flavobacterium caeni TaxID=490189 RepID=A0A1G5JZJ5_9FLAO|nr:carboxypeptidase-like regulatory domain-containing protein [Flavobacterium caeni]SCY93351.1 hypothetical protein SAMN02927903_02970 [Flavobacterium caeni]
MKTKFLLLFLLAVQLFSCSKDENNNDDYSGLPTITVSGKVVDENNDPVANAAVKIDNSETTTNSLGEFTLASGSGDGSRNFATISSEGKFDAYRGFQTKDVTTVILQVTLLGKGTVTNFDTSTGAVISNSGGNVTIGANSIMNADGSAYDGAVKGYLRMLNPSQPNFNQLMQGGDFAGVNASNQTGSLKSYGFYAIELEDPSGNPLNLSNGSTADFSLPLAAADVSNAPQTVKLWSFDKVSGIWIEEGTATKSGNKYIGNVSHFSEWNCDDWMSTVQISGTWTSIPATQCSNGLDVVSPVSANGAYILVYNMPTASSGTYAINEACDNLQTCNLFVLYMDGQGEVYSSAEGYITKTSSNSFTYSCTVVSECGYYESPVVIGLVGSGTY